MTFREAEDYIAEISVYGSVLGLDSIRELLKRLGNPQNQLQFIHVAGTNGKGSTCTFLSSILTEAGFKTGLYTSPSVFSYLEKYRVGNKKISKEDFCECLEIVQRAADSMEDDGLPYPTMFEVETAVAFVYFKRCGCQIVVLEAGMGGELDATNVVSNTLISVITSVSEDHLGQIGNSVEEIARTKAGIIKRGSYVVTGRQKKSVEREIYRHAQRMHAQFFSADIAEGDFEIMEEHFPETVFCCNVMGHIFSGAQINLPGEFQRENVYLAMTAIIILQEKGLIEISDQAIQKGIAKARWEGRLSVLHDKPLILMDGAHNPAAAASLRRSIDHYFPGRKIYMVLGMYADKDYPKVIGLLADRAEQIITVQTPDNPRALPAFDLACEVSKVNTRVSNAASVEEAFEVALLFAKPDDIILACGSLSWLGRFKKACVKRFGKKK